MIKKYIKNMLLTLLLLVCMVANVSAASEEWNGVYTEDYSGRADEAVTGGIVNGSETFSAEIKDEALMLKSDTLCYWKADDGDVSSLNSAANSHGLSVKVYNTSWICSEDTTQPDVKYTAKNTNALLIREQDGLNSLGTAKFWRLSSGNVEIKRNVVMFNVNSELFTSDDNNLVFKIKYYIIDDEGGLILTYPKNTSSDGNVAVFSEDDNKALNTWHTAEISLNNADLTRKVHSDYTFRLGGTDATAGEIYIHSVEICKTASADLDESGDMAFLEEKISESPIYGNAKLRYDMTLPENVECVESCIDNDNCIAAKYNTGKNMMSVNLSNNDKVDFATILYDLNGDSVAVYALSTDESGESVRNLLYQGNIFGETLTYTVTLDMKQGTYTVVIEQEGLEIPLETDEAFAVNNKNDINTYCTAQYIRVSHNKASQAMLCVLDNISVSGQTDPDYEAAASDVNAILLESEVTDSFTLPDVGNINESTITWESNDSAITIYDGYYAVVQRAESNVIVNLTATATYNGIPSQKQFEITVKSWEGVYFEVPECYGVIENDGTISAQATVMHPGVTGAESITFAVFSIDSTTGQICNVEYDTKPVTSTYGEMSFDSISGMDANGGNSVKCYLWDNNNRSLVNNKPTISDFKAESKVKGAGLSWKGYDDNNAIDYYEIYRNGSKIAEAPATGEEMTYLDSTVVGKNNSYSVIPVDTNSNKGEEAVNTAKCGKIPMTYYLTPIGESEAEINGNGSGITMLLKTSESSAGYTTFNTNGRIVPNGKYIPLQISSSAPTTDVVIQFTYSANAGTKLQFLYNYQVQENLGDAYTVKASDVGKGSLVFAVKLEGITLESNNGRMNNAHFALQALNGDVLVKKIEMIELSKYE